SDVCSSDLGRAMARRASGFQMMVIYTDAVRAPEAVEKELKAEFREMNTLLGESDFISVHVPLLPETRGLFNAPKFHRMKPTAFLINTSGDRWWMKPRWWRRWRAERLR